MTLRVTVEIVPFGDESKKRTLDVYNISNVTSNEGYLKNKDRYVVEKNKYKEITHEDLRIHHERSRGYLPLVIKALSLY